MLALVGVAIAVTGSRPTAVAQPQVTTGLWLPSDTQVATPTGSTTPTSTGTTSVPPTTVTTTTDAARTGNTTARRAAGNPMPPAPPPPATSAQNLTHIGIAGTTTPTASTSR
ncbi:MAG TPA: hypothetical protein VHX38_12745 [Pseudonocardiaceae bacterium]|nr:hypothetical protein [Pseudonocardiaceae bacterium]